MEIMTRAQRLSRRVFNQAPLQCKTEIAIFCLEPMKHARPIIKCHTEESMLLTRVPCCSVIVRAEQQKKPHQTGLKHITLRE